MKRYSTGQKRALSDFFNMIAVGWFTAGVIAPFFTSLGSVSRAGYFILGMVLGYLFLKISLFFVKDVSV